MLLLSRPPTCLLSLQHPVTPFACTPRTRPVAPSCKGGDRPDDAKLPKFKCCFASARPWGRRDVLLAERKEDERGTSRGRGLVGDLGTGDVPAWTLVVHNSSLSTIDQTVEAHRISSPHPSLSQSRFLPHTSHIRVPKMVLGAVTGWVSVGFIARCYQLGIQKRHPFESECHG